MASATGRWARPWEFLKLRCCFDCAEHLLSLVAQQDTRPLFVHLAWVWWNVIEVPAVNAFRADGIWRRTRLVKEPSAYPTSQNWADAQPQLHRYRTPV